MVYIIENKFEFKSLKFFFLSHFGLREKNYEKIDIAKSHILYTIWKEILSRIKNAK